MWRKDQAAWQQYHDTYANDPAYAAYYQQYPQGADQQAYYDQYYQQQGAYDAATQGGYQYDYSSYGYGYPTQRAAQGYYNQGYAYSQQPAATTTATTPTPATAPIGPPITPTTSTVKTGTAPSQQYYQQPTAAAHYPATTGSNNTPISPLKQTFRTDQVNTVGLGIGKKAGKKIKTITPSSTATMAVVPPAPPSPAVSNPPPEPVNPEPLSMESWPDSLKAYVEDVFRYSPPEMLDLAQNELRKLIMEKHNAGTLLTIDWSEMDLPSACETPANRKSKKKKASINGSSSSISGTSKINNRKKGPSFVETPEEEEKRKIRLRRFQESNQIAKRKPSPPVQLLPTPTAGDDMDWDKHIVIGTATNLEKNYLRLTSAPDPATVRPLPVLRQTLELLKSKWKEERNYTYICDQFKSLRQDLTVQHIKNEFTVQVYEIHARIALEKADLGEFNQNQTQLKYLYAQGIKGNVNEFTAYRLLYFLHTQNWADINSVMASITSEQKNCHAVQHALDVRSAMATSNYHRLFKLYVTAPNMGGYLMDQFIERERVQALIILCKSYRPHLALDFIVKELAFDNMEFLVKFLQEQARVFPSQLKANILDTKLAAVGLSESMKKYKKIDIKGQL